MRRTPARQKIVNGNAAVGVVLAGSVVERIVVGLGERNTTIVSRRCNIRECVGVGIEEVYAPFPVVKTACNRDCVLV